MHITSCAKACDDIASRTLRLYFLHMTAYDRPSPDSRCHLVRLFHRFKCALSHFKHNLILNFSVFCLSHLVLFLPTMEIDNNAKSLSIFAHIYEPTTRPRIDTTLNVTPFKWAYRGLSGISRDPAARMAPMMH